MSTEMVAQVVRKIVATRLPLKNPRWAFNAEEWNTTLPSKVVKIKQGLIAYSLNDLEARSTLAMHMQYVIDSVFEMIPAHHRDGEVYYQKDFMMESAGLFAKDSNVTLLARVQDIQWKLNSFFDVMNKVYAFSQQPDALFADYRVGKAVRKYVKSLNELTNRSATPREYAAVDAIKDRDAVWIHFDVSSCEPTLKTFLVTREFKPEIQNEETVAHKEAQKETTREEWLLSLSPDLLAAYKEAEEEFDEVSPLVTTPEDEYFTEQVKNEYYPRIFESLSNLNESTDFSYKEAVVVESIKQFKIIQLGLQRIMDSIVAAKLNSIRSQTDFLANKVLGPNAITLTPDERNEKLETTLEEAHQVREELYKKHVAPVLAQNKADYEEKLAEQQTKDDARYAKFKEKHTLDLQVMATAHKQQLSDLNKTHEEDIRLLNLKHHKELRKLEAQHKANHSALVAKYKENGRAATQYEQGIANQNHYKNELEEYRRLNAELESEINQLHTAMTEMAHRDVQQLHKPQSLEEFTDASVKKAASVWHREDLEEEEGADYSPKSSDDHDFFPAKRPSVRWSSLLPDEEAPTELWDEEAGF